MPRGDGTGPLGQGPMTGRGMPGRQGLSGGGGGRGAGRGAGGSRGGIGQGGGGRGLGGGNRPGAGPVGSCVCPSCKAKVSHQRGVACYSVNCPKCGNKMARE